MDAWTVLFLAVGGVAAGFVNTVAGGGMMITLPLLVFAGLPETVANGTARIGVLAQGISSSWTYHRDGALNVSRFGPVLPPVILGAGVGAYIGANLSDEVFRFIFGGVMLGFGVLLVTKPRARDADLHSEDLSARYQSLWIRWLILVPVGVYGGMIQAGMGYVVIAALTLGFRFSLMEANVLKVVIVAAYTPLVLGVFWSQGQTQWPPGLVLAGGQTVGAYLGARFALRRGVKVVRYMLLLVIVVSGLQLLGAWRHLAQWMMG